jgi:hypothetical protein
MKASRHQGLTSWSNGPSREQGAGGRDCQFSGLQAAIKTEWQIEDLLQRKAEGLEFE